MIEPLLLLGFEPFGAWEHNSTIDVTARAAELLDAEGIPVRRAVAEVVLDRVPVLLDELLDEGPTCGLIACGLSGRSAEVEVERWAKNVARFRIPDNEGRFVENEPLVSGGANELKTTLDLAALSRSFEDLGIPHCLSDSAGTYLCNAMYFHSLLRLLPRGRPALFLHLPPLPGAAMLALERDPDAAVGEVSMPFEQQVSAVVAAARLVVSVAAPGQALGGA